MNLDTLGEFGGLALGFMLTIFVLSFVFKDNPLYRLAVHMLVGVSAGYAAYVVTREVFAPVFNEVFVGSVGEAFFWFLPLLLALLLIFKAVPRFAWLGNSAMAVVMSVGASVALVGAVVGTFIPLVLIQYENRLLGLVVGLLAICALAYFFFTGRQDADGKVTMAKWYPYVAIVGQVVITVTLAALFTGILNTSLVLLTERIGFFINGFGEIFTIVGT